MNKSLPLILLAILSGCGAKYHPDSVVDIDDYTSTQINRIITSKVKTADQKNTGEIIAQVSAEFLGTPYKANMLIGSSTEPEKLVIDFRGLDCFTYLDYVESLRRSENKTDFITQLVSVRYINSDINYPQRKHFFTDWSQRNPLNAEDVTAGLSKHAVTITKHLNEKSDGGVFLPGVEVATREIVYIPSEFIDDSVIDQLKDGDYIGIYTNIAGLDVTHTGIFIMTTHGPVLRNASSLKINNQVVDSPFIEYVKKSPGIIVLRAL